MAALEAAEAKFAEDAGKFGDQVLDLNVPQATLAKAAMEIMNQRAKLLGLYGVPVETKWTSPLGGSGAAAPPGGQWMEYMSGLMQQMQHMQEWPGAEPVRWVAKLHETLAKVCKRPLTKGELAFATEAADEAGKLFTSTVTFPEWGASYASPAPAKSKKEAEHAAAEAAMKAEYPAEYQALAGWGRPAWGQKKRKAPGEEAPAIAVEGKSRLSYLMQMILGRSTTKEDVVYECTEPAAPGEPYRATVHFPTYEAEPGLQCQGDGPNKKDAEVAAAKAACKRLEPVAAPFIEEHKAKKARKNKEALEKLKKAQEEKKAALVATAD